MKSYEEMTDAVLVRAKAERALQKRRRGVAAAVACLCIIGLVVFAGAQINHPSGVKEGWEPRASLFCVTANAETQRKPMLKDEKVPYNAVIRVRDITGMEPSELLELQIADREYAERMAGENTDDPPGNSQWSATSWSTEKTMITTVFAGSFYLTVDDYQQIQDISVSTTEIGWAAQHIADYYDTSMKDGIGITWSLSQVGLKMLEKDPELDLSKLTDTLTVTVEYKDGTKEIARIDITIDHDGQIYGTFREIYCIG